MRNGVAPSRPRCSRPRCLQEPTVLNQRPMMARDKPSARSTSNASSASVSPAPHHGPRTRGARRPPAAGRAHPPLRLAGRPTKVRLPRDPQAVDLVPERRLVGRAACDVLTTGTVIRCVISCSASPTVAVLASPARHEIDGLPDRVESRPWVACRCKPKWRVCSPRAGGLERLGARSIAEPDLTDADEASTCSGRSALSRPSSTLFSTWAPEDTVVWNIEAGFGADAVAHPEGRQPAQRDRPAHDRFFERSDCARAARLPGRPFRSSTTGAEMDACPMEHYVRGSAAAAGSADIHPHPCGRRFTSPVSAGSSRLRYRGERELLRIAGALRRRRISAAPRRPCSRRPD